MKINAFVGSILTDMTKTSETDSQYVQLKQMLFCAAQKCIPFDDGAVFICSMNEDIGIWAAESVILLQNALPMQGIQLWCVIPYNGFAKNWGVGRKKRYHEILEKAERVIIIGSGPMLDIERRIYHWLSDEADHLIAVHDGKPGNTQDIIVYARRKGLDITIIEP